MSHHSSAKPLVREVRNYLPRHVNAWIDEHELLAGANLAQSLREAIQVQADFLVLFLDDRAARSQWVRSEISWALEEERRSGRPFVLPIVLSDEAVDDLPWIGDRLFLKCHGYGETDVRHLANELSSALFAWLSRDLEALRALPAESAQQLEAFDRADMLLKHTAAKIRELVFPYRRDHPLPLEELLRLLQQRTDLNIGTRDELHELLFRLRDRRMISGLALTSRTIYVGEEHLNWRAQEALAAKQTAAEYLADQLQDGDTIYLDAGSSTLALAREISRGIRFSQWHHLEIFTNSVPIAAHFSELANSLGMEDDDSRLRLIVVGGQMRLNTSALVDCPEEPALEWEQAAFDVAVIGTNGVSVEHGCTTTTATEAVLKRKALLLARRRYVMAEASKYGVWQSEPFASFDDGITLVTALEGDDPRVDDVMKATEGSVSSVVVVTMKAEGSDPV